MSARGEQAAASTGDLLCFPVSLLLGDGSSVVKDDDVAFVVWVVCLHCCENTEEDRQPLKNVKVQKYLLFKSLKIKRC
jgi:hypothetical protein